jgi:hypothetical protein
MVMAGVVAGVEMDKRNEKTRIQMIFGLRIFTFRTMAYFNSLYIESPIDPGGRGKAGIA